MHQPQDLPFVHHVRRIFRRRAPSYMYDWRIKLVGLSPLSMDRRHDINLLEFKGSLFPHALEDDLGVIAERTLRSGEEGDAGVEVLEEG